MKKWKLIKGFEKYKISNEGDVLSLDYNHEGYEKLLSLRLKRGYYQVGLCDGTGARYWKTVHRLVAEAFIGSCPDKHETNHKDGNKLNNSVENLEWLTCSENQKHAHKLGLKNQTGSKNNGSKLNEFQVQRMRLMKEIDPKMTHKRLGGIFGIHDEHAACICRRQVWQHVY